MNEEKMVFFTFGRKHLCLLTTIQANTKHKETTCLSLIKYFLCSYNHEAFWNKSHCDNEKLIQRNKFHLQVEIERTSRVKVTC